MAHAEQPSGTAPSNPDRRGFIAASIGLAAAAAAAGTAGAATVLQSAPNASKEKKMPFTLPELPYAENALEPVIDAKTMNIHRTKHHQAYVDNLNKALEGHADLQGKSIEELCAGVATLPDAIKGARPGGIKGALS